MSGEEIATYGGNVLIYIMSAIQSNPVLQYVELVLAIITSVVLLAYRIWKWYKEAKKDGKITKEELKEGLNILSEGAEEIKDKIKKKGDINEKD